MLMVQRIILELLSFSLTIAAAVLMRWLLYLSTPAQDWYWLQRQEIWYHLGRLKWYRGTEYLHQVKFQRLLRGIEE